MSKLLGKAVRAIRAVRAVRGVKVVRGSGLDGADAAKVGGPLRFAVLVLLAHLLIVNNSREGCAVHGVEVLEFDPLALTIFVASVGVGNFFAVIVVSSVFFRTCRDSPQMLLSHFPKNPPRIFALMFRPFPILPPCFWLRTLSGQETKVPHSVELYTQAELGEVDLIGTLTMVFALVWSSNQEKEPFEAHKDPWAREQD